MKTPQIAALPGMTPLGVKPAYQPDTRLAEYATGDADFDAFMAEIDQVIRGRTGLGVYDLPDCMFRDMHEDEMSAEEAADEVLEYAGWHS